MKNISMSILFLSALVGPLTLLAQEKEKVSQGIEWGLHTGPVLPNQIQGMSEILLSWGGRFGFPTPRGQLEFGIINGRGSGIEYYNVSASLRGDMMVEDLTGIFYIGFDGHYYSPPDTSQFVFVAGGHVGTGIIMHVGGDVWFRSDMKFNMNPGTALYIGFGFVLRGKSEGAGAAAAPSPSP